MSPEEDIKNTTPDETAVELVKDADGNKLIRTIITIALVALVVRFAYRDIHRFLRILQVLVGFGAVVFVHELGHFVAAKSVGIYTEGFALGFGPAVIGIKRRVGGFLVRILPSIIPGKDGAGALAFTIPYAKAKEGETEYRVNLIPLGGYVKMLGQEDVAADKPSDNPRAYPNKAPWQRMIVIAAGVVMNVICAAITFMIVFAHGVQMPAPIIGGVIEGSPAEKAGLKAGDEVIQIGDRSKYLRQTELNIAAVLAEPCQPVPMVVRHPDGSEETFHVTPKYSDVTGTPIFGILPAETTTIGGIQEKDAREALNDLGLRAGDRITAVNGEPVEHGYELTEAMTPAIGVKTNEKLTLTVIREDKDAEATSFDIDIPMVLAGSELLGMRVPLRIPSVAKGRPAERAGFQIGDVIMRVGPQQCPSLEELRDVLDDFNGKPVVVDVLRTVDGAETTVALTVTPDVAGTKGLRDKIVQMVAADDKKPRPTLGVGIDFWTEQPIVGSVDPSAAAGLSIPRGARIRTVAGQDVENWEGILTALSLHRGEDVAITYEADGAAADVTVAVPDDDSWIGMIYLPDFGDLPTLPLTQYKKTYRGSSLAENLDMGLTCTYRWLVDNYGFFKAMISAKASPKAASGPVGIMKMSYTVAEQSGVAFYCYFMAIISIAIAVFNFMPLPILDGGHFVMLIIEKLRGRPVPIKVQEVISYVGLGLILCFALYVTFNDVIKILTNQL